MPDEPGTSNGPGEPEGRRIHVLWALRGQVERYVRSRGVDRAVVDDVVAETYLAAVRRLDEVPSGEGQALGWLCGVARRALANARRSTQRAKALAERLAADGRRHRHAGIGQVDATRFVAAEAWQSLSDDDRRILSLVGWHGMSLEELAALLGCSGGAATTRVSRARARLASDGSV